MLHSYFADNYDGNHNVYPNNMRVFKTVTLTRVRESFWPRKSNKHYTVCARTFMRACGGAQARRRVHVALLIQHATRMPHIVTSFVASLAPPHSSTLSHKRHDYR
jgi:hypothetical protein